MRWKPGWNKIDTLPSAGIDKLAGLSLCGADPGILDFLNCYKATNFDLMPEDYID